MPDADSSQPKPLVARLHGVPLRALCLDLDDTILDNHGSYHDTIALTARRIVATHDDLDLSEVVRTIERTDDAWWSDADKLAKWRLDLPRARREVIGLVLDALERSDAALADALTTAWTRHREDALRMHDGAHALLARLRASVPRLALVTNGAAEAQRAKIERFDLAAYFDHVQIEGEFGVGKPDAVVYEHVLACLDAPPDESLMVGDSFECDVLGALSVGMHAAWIDVRRKGVSPSPAPRAHFVLRGLTDLADLLGV